MIILEFEQYGCLDHRIGEYIFATDDHCVNPSKQKAYGDGGMNSCSIHALNMEFSGFSDCLTQPTFN